MLTRIFNNLIGYLDDLKSLSDFINIWECLKTEVSREILSYVFSVNNFTVHSKYFLVRLPNPTLLLYPTVSWFTLSLSEIYF